MKARIVFKMGPRLVVYLIEIARYTSYCCFNSHGFLIAKTHSQKFYFDSHVYLFCLKRQTLKGTLTIGVCGRIAQARFDYRKRLGGTLCSYVFQTVGEEGLPRVPSRNLPSPGFYHQASYQPSVLLSSDQSLP